MRITILIFWTTIFFCCSTPEVKEVESKASTDNFKANATPLVVECIQNDTITSMGTKIHYFYSNGKYKISCGNDSFNRMYDSLYSCDYDLSSGLWDFVPKLNSETKNFLIFANTLWTSSGANPAPIEYYAIVFPKNNNDSIFEKEFFINSIGEYLIYGDSENDKIHLINLETKKSQTVKLKPKPNLSRSPTLAIKKTEIIGESFKIKYESIDKKNEILIIEKSFKIEI